MKPVVTWKTIDDGAAGQRIDNFLLTQLKGVPRSRVYRLIRKGEVRVNKKRVEQTYRLQLEDVVRIPPVQMDAQQLPIKLNDAVTDRLNNSVLYEDDRLLVLNKPAGMAVHGGSGIQAGVIEYLREIRPEAKFLELAHRLDRDTSGCLMIAKTRASLVELHQLLRDREVRKIYRVLVVGAWPKQVHKVDAPLEKNVLSSGERIVKVARGGQESVTTFNVVQRFPAITLIEAFPHTGRTHQIRVHCACTGHPVVGDERYGESKTNQELSKQLESKRIFLHAYTLKLTLPSTGTKIEVEAPLDSNWEQAIQRASHGRKIV